MYYVSAVVIIHVIRSLFCYIAGHLSSEEVEASMVIALRMNLKETTFPSWLIVVPQPFLRTILPDQKPFPQKKNISFVKHNLHAATR